VDTQPTQPAANDAGPNLLRRIEAIAADVGGEPESDPATTARLDALAGRLEAVVENRLAAEISALREDLADALEELSAGLQQRMAAIEASIEAAIEAQSRR
jgi:hypothetical protein